MYYHRNRVVSWLVVGFVPHINKFQTLIKGSISETFGELILYSIILYYVVLVFLELLLKITECCRILKTLAKSLKHLCCVIDYSLLLSSLSYIYIMLLYVKYFLWISNDYTCLKCKWFIVTLRWMNFFTISIVYKSMFDNLLTCRLTLFCLQVSIWLYLLCFGTVYMFVFIW